MILNAIAEKLKRQSKDDFGLVANFHRGLGYPLKDAIFMFC
ncbi:hypothetical protein [Rhizobium ruizarguesonis]